jgi:hypothetical protein
MLKKIALIGLFASFSVVSINAPRPSASSSRPASERLPKVESQPMRGGPCLPGLPRC